MANNYTLPLLAELEADALHLLREAAAELEHPVLGHASTQDSACLQRLAQAAFAPGAVPFAHSGGGAQIGSDRSHQPHQGLWGHLDVTQPRVFPLADWTPADVQRYLAGASDVAPQPELLRVVVVGAEGADKSTLAAQLAKHAAGPRRRLIVTDAAQSTRSLAAAASSAEVALMVVDAVQGVSMQTRRHAFLCSLLGVPRLVVAVSQKYDEVRAEFESFAARLSFKSIDFVPLRGDDVQPLLRQLEDLYIGADRNLVDLRFQVQAVTRADGARWYLGRVASGVVKPGDEVVLLPAHRRTRVRALRLGERALDYAYAPLSVALSLEEDVDVGRGAVLAHARNLPHGVRALDSMVVWLDAEPLAAGRVYLLKHGAAWVRASCAEVTYRFDAESLHRTGGDRLRMDDTGRASFTLFEERFVDAYAQNRGAGGFLIADSETRRTLGAGMVVDRESEPARVGRAKAAKRFIVPHQSKVTTADRARLLEQSALTLWLTGLSGSGKSTLATELERHLVESGRACYMLDGDNVRAGINRDLGFGPDDRRENIRRIAEVARLMNDAGLIVVTAFISPYRADRDMARTIIGAERFVEVFVDASLQVCETRDPKGLYRKARKGEIPEFTGISAPYEPPEAPALALDTAASPIAKCVDELLGLVLSRARQ